MYKEPNHKQPKKKKIDKLEYSKAKNFYVSKCTIKKMKR